MINFRVKRLVIGSVQIFGIVHRAVAGGSNEGFSAQCRAGNGLNTPPLTAQSQPVHIVTGVSTVVFDAVKEDRVLRREQVAGGYGDGNFLGAAIEADLRSDQLIGRQTRGGQLGLGEPVPTVLTHRDFPPGIHFRPGPAHGEVGRLPDHRRENARVVGPVAWNAIRLGNHRVRPPGDRQPNQCERQNRSLHGTISGCSGSEKRTVTVRSG